MSQELNRNFTVLKDKADPKPYFLSYEITELEYKTLSGTLGTIDSTGGEKTASSMFPSASARRSSITTIP